MSEIWVVTAGRYSDYHFVCAFTRRDLAEAYAEAMNRAEFEGRRDWDWIFGDQEQFEAYMEAYGDDYGLRAEACQLWDSLPVAPEPERGR